MAPPIPIIVFLLVLSPISSSSLPPEPPEGGIRVVFAERLVTYIKMPSNMLESHTVVDPTSWASAEVKYGPYYNQMPVTFLRINLHYEKRPFLAFEKLERKVDIPRWGHIKVTDQYKMRHDDAWYKRIFSRPECHRNWPTAHSLLSSNKDRLYHNLNPGPRYSWHCTFTVDYGLPLEDFLFQSEDGRRYINLTFGVPLLDTVVNDFTIMVVLPEGSKNPQPIIPFPMEAISMRTTYWQRFWALLQRDDAMARLAGRALEMEKSYSYVAARAKVVLKKKNLVAEHSVPFQVYYESNPIFMLTDRPLTLLSAALVCIACWIIHLYFS